MFILDKLKRSKHKKNFFEETILDQAAFTSRKMGLKKENRYTRFAWIACHDKRQ